MNTNNYTIIWISGKNKSKKIVEKFHCTYDAVQLADQYSKLSLQQSTSQRVSLLPKRNQSYQTPKIKEHVCQRQKQTFCRSVSLQLTFENIKLITIPGFPRKNLRRIRSQTCLPWECNTWVATRKFRKVRNVSVPIKTPLEYVTCAEFVPTCNIRGVYTKLLAFYLLVCEGCEEYHLLQDLSRIQRPTELHQPRTEVNRYALLGTPCTV